MSLTSRLRVLEEDGMLNLVPHIVVGIDSLLTHVEELSSLKLHKEQMQHGLRRIKAACEDAEKEVDKL